MIPIRFYKKDDEKQQELIRIKFCDANLAKRQPAKIKKLNRWCAAHLPLKDGRNPYTINDVIVASPERLIAIKKYLDDCGNLETINRELYNIRDDGTKGSCYVIGTLYQKMNDEAKDFLIKSFNISVCPYCNRNYVFSSHKVNTFQLDHFFGKEKYPILAASFYNLIPVCGICNLFKKDKAFSYYPHLSKNEEILRFSFLMKGTDYLENKESLEITLNDIPEKYADQINELKLWEIYQGHKDILTDILKKHMVFSDAYIQALVEKFQSLGDFQSVKELIYGVPMSKEERNNRPLSKFTQDIMDEMNSI